jgi:anion-transporting  ArsA/GET3 family ATPase
MESYTEGLLRDKLREVRAVATAFTSRLIAEELELPDSESNNESFEKLKTLQATIIVNTVKLAKADWERQERKLRMPQEDFNSAVLADLVKSRDLLAQLKELYEDLERLKAFAKRQEQIGEMVVSNLERLRMEPSSVRISKNSL